MKSRPHHYSTNGDGDKEMTDVISVVAGDTICLFYFYSSV